MKQTIKFFGFIAIAAMAFVACNKEEDVVETPTFTHRVTIHAVQPETKTVISEGGTSASFKWSSDDASRFTVTENGVAGTDVVLTSNDSYATMALSANFATETASSYEYAAYLSKNKTAGGAPKIPAAQTSTSTSYDPDADILIAKTESFSSVQSELDMEFGRPVVINKMTLKGLDKDEAISSITVSADKDIIGYYTIASDAWTGQGSEITISTAQTVPTGGQIIVYFVTMPADDVTLTVTVTTGNYIYSKQFTKTINFEAGKVTAFGVSSLSRIDKSDYSGTYVLANTTGTAMANAWADSNSIPEATSYLDGDVIYYDPDEVTISNAKITLDKVTDTSSEFYGMYTMVQNGLYLYAAKADANQLKGEDTPDVNAYWEISEAAGVWSIVASKSNNRNILKYNPGNKIFSCYASGQDDVMLVSSFAPSPFITASDIVIEADAVASTNTGATFNSNTASVAAVAYDDSGLTTTSTWLTASVSGTTVNYEATKNTGDERVAYIKITATNSDSHSVVKVITVTQAEPGSSSKVDVLNQSWTGVTSTSSYENKTNLAGSASDAKYSVNCCGGNSSIQLRSNNNNSGIVSTTSGGKVKKVTVTWQASTSDGRTLDIYGKSSAYSAPSDLYSSSTAGTKLGSIVKGTSTQLEISGDYEYIGLRSNSGAMYLTEVRIEWETGSSPAPTTYAVSWTAPTQAGCSISATVSGTAINSGDVFAEGTEVTITATAGTGFTFSGWSLTGASATDASAATTTFTIGTSDVTIAATFNSNSGGGTDPVEVTFVAGTDTSSETTLTKGAVTISVSSGTLSRTDNYRVYAGNTLTISTSTGNIKSIAFTTVSTADNNATQLSTETGTYSGSGTSGTWSGSASSVTFTAAKQCRITQIVVTYE